DLDLDTLRTLEDFLEDWPGALVVVSHDRAFLERTVDDVVVLDGEGRAGRRPGGYAAWEQERREGRTSGTLRQRETTPVAGSRPDRGAVAAAVRPSGRAPSPSTLRAKLKQVEKAIQPLDK